MIQHFEKLNEEEEEKMVNAIPLITILIAGADGKIDAKEKSWAAKVAKIRTYSNPEELHDYYIHVGRAYSDKLNKFIDQLPINMEGRNEKISSQLGQLNSIFAKLDPFFASTLYQSFLSFAKHVAKASGGFLGFGSISKMENQWLELPMITPIFPPDEKE